MDRRIGADTNPQDIFLLLPSPLYNHSLCPLLFSLSSEHIAVVVYPAFYPTGVHPCTCRYSFVHTDRPRRHVRGPATIPNQKAGVTLASSPLAPRTGVSGCDRHRRGIEMRGSKRGKHPAQWRAAREEWEHRPTVAQGGSYVLVTLRLDAPSTSTRNDVHTTSAEPAQRRGTSLGFLRLSCT